MQFVKKTLLEKRFWINNYNLIVKYEEYVFLITNTFLYLFSFEKSFIFFSKKKCSKNGITQYLCTFTEKK